MKIFINGEEFNTQTINLEKLMLEQNFTQNWLASAVNSNLVKKQDRANYNLKEGDKIEILSPMQGG